MSYWQMVIVKDILFISIPELCKRYSFSSEFLWTRTKENRQGSTSYYHHIKGVDPTIGRKPITLISYTSIPEQTRIDKGMPSLEELLKQYKETELFRLTGIDEIAYQFFLKEDNVKDTKEATREHIAKGKAEQVHLLKAIASFKTKEITLRGYANKKDFYSFCITAMNKLAVERKWYKYKCNTVGEFVKRLTAVKKNDYTFFINAKVNNANAEKTNDDQKALLVQIYSGLHRSSNTLGYDSNAKPNIEQTWEIYTRKAEEMVRLGHWDKKCLIGAGAVRSYLFKNDITQLWFEARHGYQEYRNIFEPITQRERASYANALWVIDGTPSHRYFQHGDKGRYFRFNLFPVLDAHSWCVIGFWLSETENTEAVLGALRSACMVSGCMPHQILYDNSSAIKSYRAQEAVDMISVVSFAATAGNARTKIIEPFFALFNKDIQKFRPGYTANPFALTIDNRPNKEALARMVKSEELPAAAQAVNQAIEDLNLWNNKPRKFLGGLSPIQAYRQSVEATRAKQRSFTKTIDIEAFWTIPGEHKKIRTYEDGKPKMVTTFLAQEYEFTNRGIDIKIDGKPFTYDIEDAEFRKLYIGKRFKVRYEPNQERWTNGQPGELLLYLQGAPLQWKGMHVAALPKRLIPMAVADYQPGTRAEVTERQANKKKQRALVQQEFHTLINRTLTNKTFTEVITENAFDKVVLTNTTEQIFNWIIDGKDNWFNTPEPKEEIEQKAQEEKPLRMDRLAGYDEPLPLSD